MSAEAGEEAGTWSSGGRGDESSDGRGGESTSGRGDGSARSVRMDRGRKTAYLPGAKGVNLLENLAIVILAFYPLRHINWGLDLWDTGYNYANFQYMGTEHMDSMWLFSTYLANVAGNWLGRLPRADTLLGMNLYTGLFVSALALIGYFFCTRKLGMPRITTFVGEMAAISLCWCPTALLYNYLTYVFFLLAFILLYLGLAGEKRGYLIGAGVLLGANVLVRFSNLPEAAMIVAVWAYDGIVWAEAPKGKRDKFWPRLLRHTLWCLLGYVAALALLFGYIHIRYGMDAYMAGIRRLFAMTEKAADYRATSMIVGIVKQYVENLYWVIRIGAIIAGGMLLFALADLLESRLEQSSCQTKPLFPEKLFRPEVSARQRKKPRPAEVLHRSGAALWLHVGIRVLWIGVSAAMLGWLYYRGFCSLLFYSYDPIWRPGPIFLMLTMFIAAVRIFQKSSPREEKLLGGMLILVILLTSIGSNNGVLPSLNNLFVAAPYTLWQSWRFIREAGDWIVGDWNWKAEDRKTGDGRPGGSLKLCFFPAKTILTAFLGLCLFQFGMFGAKFVFAEATGVRNATAAVENNEILRGIRMSPQKAQWMWELSAYVNENELAGSTVILYGKIPALSYYLQMPSAFNPWSDLDSYSLEAMERDMAQLMGDMEEKGACPPAILVENRYALSQEGEYRWLSSLPEQFKEACALGRAGLLRQVSVLEEYRQAVEQDEKWQLIMAFMERFGYEQVFRNEKFGMYRRIP